MPINTVLNVSKRINNGRTVNDVMNSIMEEVGELAREVRCEYGPSYKKAGRDGILGESVDVLASVIDLMYIHDPDISHRDIINVLNRKMSKWEEKEMEHALQIQKESLELCVHDWKPYWNETEMADWVECTACGEKERNFHPSCCNKENRNWNGCCTECGAPCF